MKSVLMTMPFVLALASAAMAQDSGDEFAAGREEYLAACAACHGENADGNGPIAGMFKERVPDLRKISAENDGVFPTQEIFMIIDGRTGIRGHGAPMPLFGKRYKAELSGEIGPFFAEQVVRTRILELVLYLQSIQE